MIDEYFDRLVDRWCRDIPKAVRPWQILFRNSFIGWRIRLYLGTLFSKIAAAFGHISSEENMDLFMRETAERGDDTIERVKRFWKEQVLAVSRLESRGRSIRFTASLFLMMLAVLGVAATGSGALGVTAASLCILWLSVAIESGYAPVCGALRQRHLISTLLRTGAVSLMLIHYFSLYVSWGLPSNVVLQSTMLITLFVHAAMYLALIAFNHRQPLFLRALAAATGVMPALTAACALAVAASLVFRPWPLPAAGVAGALGAVLAFAGDQLISAAQLGGIRLKYHSIWVCLMMTGGYAMMLLGAWLYAL